MPDMHGRLV